MNLSDNTEKMAIVERLVKEGAIDFTEAIKLLTKEVEFTYIPPVTTPWTQPYDPYPLTIPCGGNITDTIVRYDPNVPFSYTSLHN